eukprot:TRINITY_DN65768_c0_g1_i1.p1 TRINITY_DN65768_c0_g1~~TRINITY_DN65768_c0_g1_i1.p1  ORF type:complete len:317 (+),score=58.67 TRINITY_DN65768_c0_g1_i1:101-1051(+)
MSRGVKSSRSCRGSVKERFALLEANMLANLEEMRAHRKGLQEVVQARKEKSEKLKQSLLQKPDEVPLNDLTLDGVIDTAAPKENRTMKERIAAMQDNSEQNQEVILGHRKILDQVLAVRQEAMKTLADAQRQATGGSAVLASAASAQPEVPVMQEEMSSTERRHVIETNSRWMGTALQKAAVSKAKTDEERAALAGTGSRPQSASVAKSNDQPFDMTRPSRPASASANRYGANQSGTFTRPTSAMSRGSRSSSRPSSANSLNARCRNIQESLERNRGEMMNHRSQIDLVVKMRQERAERMTQDLLASLKAMQNASR